MQLRLIIAWLGIFCCWSCQQEQEVKLRGHWHLTEGGTFGDGNTLDFVNDSTVITGARSRFNGYAFYWNKEEKKIIGTGELSYVYLDYKIIDSDNIELYTQSDTIKAFACGETCCDWQEEYWGDLLVEIDLPYFEKLPQFAPSTIKVMFELPYFLGKPKAEYQADYGDTTRLALGNKFVREKMDMLVYQEQLKVKLPSSKADQIRSIIIADKDTPMRSFELPLDSLRRIGNKEVLFAIRHNESVHDSLQLLVRSFGLDTLQIEGNGTYEEWLSGLKE